MKINLKTFIYNNKKTVILLLAGIILIFAGNILTGNDNNDKNNDKEFTSDKINERKLEKILSNIQGAGKVNVFITYENTGVTEYALDSKSVADDGVTSEKKHVFANKEPVINAYINAQVRGVIVTATGAGSADVKNSLLKAVKAVTGIGYDRISVEIGVK